VKHYPPSELQKSSRFMPLMPSRFHEEADIVAHIRSLVITDGKVAVAKQLGVTQRRVSMILRGQWPVPIEAAEALGYRRVVHFERID
jgi:hypothetical protein